MKSTILLNSNENTRKIEEEEKSRFVKGIIDSMGIPIEGVWDDADELSIENKIKLRSILSNYNVGIIDDFDGELKIYVDNDLVGEWKKCEYLLKKDVTARDPRKQLFIEMKINCWSIFENTE